jgi:hypothetical protein
MPVRRDSRGHASCYHGATTPQIRIISILGLVAASVIAASVFLQKPSAPQDKSTHRAGINVYDGFETATLGNAWESSRFAPGAVEMQTDHVRAGHGAVKLKVRSHDQFEAGINGNSDSERAELLEARELTSIQDTVYEYSFSMLFPQSFPIVPTRLVVAQWKQYCPENRNCSDDSPVLAIRYMSGVLSITQDIGKKQMVLWQEKNEFRNRWLDFKFQVRFSTGRDGRIKAWLSDRQLLNYTGVTANAENESTGYRSPGRFYFKMGLYRNVMAEPMTVYLDEYRKTSLPD